MIRIFTVVLVIAISPMTTPKAQFLGCPLIDQITLEDCKVLEKLFYDTDGYNWRNVRGWLYTNQPCDWYGITCRSSDWPREIIRIDLSGNNLTGTLPGELAFLTELQSIRIDNSGPGIRLRKLTGQIPSTLGDLEHLEVLTLGSNAFTGSIPPKLGELTSLREMSLSDNQLEGFLPESFGQLYQLQHLNLSKNGLRGPIPDTLQNLSKLEYFNLSQNDFSGRLPHWLGDLSLLRFFDVSNNQLSGTMPEEFINLDQLAWLSLADNDLDGALSLSTASYAASIVNCDLRGNQMCIPNAPPYADLNQVCSLSPDKTCKACQGQDCSSLESVYFETDGASWTQDHGWLASVDPCEWHGIGCKDNEITSIILPDNGLSGTLPSSLSSLENLQTLNLSENNLHGSIPQEYVALSQLTTLDLSSNQLTGVLPLSVASLGARLNQCNLSKNAGICLPDNAEYAALNVDPICHLPLRKDCLGYNFVTFNELRAVPGKRSIELIWSTTQSSAMITFVVERVEPPIILAEILGSAKTPNTFTYTVNNLDPGQYSFQIQQIIANGAYKVTEPITVELYAGDLVTGTAYPNPFSTATTFEFTSGTHGSVNIGFYDLLGRRVRTLFDGTPPLHKPMRITLDAEDLPSGTYLIYSFLDDHLISSQQIILIR